MYYILLRMNVWRLSNQNGRSQIEMYVSNTILFLHYFSANMFISKLEQFGRRHDHSTEHQLHENECQRLLQQMEWNLVFKLWIYVMLKDIKWE
jgi:hypothetical protein